jgi:predicted TIM-barrel fold metal-dependent hydrolase
MGRGGPWIGGYVKGRPSEIFKQYVRVSPYHEEDIGGLMDLLGPEGVLFGSDYPHSEGLANPVDFADAIRDRPVEDLRKVMRDNALELVRTR